MEPDIQAYISVMEEIKRRIAIVSALLSNSIILNAVTQVELMVLQVRMITELIALASLAANKEIFEQHQRKFEKHWDPVKILKDVEQLNPGFYPKPVAEIPSENLEGKVEMVDLENGFMERGELIEVHGRCGNVLHARNPYGKSLDYEVYGTVVPKWINRIMVLLNCHIIKLFDDNRFYLVHMKDARDDHVHMYTFQRTDA